jgi:hypothetical protein
MRQTRHKSTEVALCYLRPADLWRNNVTEGCFGAARRNGMAPDLPRAPASVVPPQPAVSAGGTGVLPGDRRTSMSVVHVQLPDLAREAVDRHVAAASVAAETDFIFEAAHRNIEDLAWGARASTPSLTSSALSPFELRQAPSRCSGQLRHAIRRCPPKDINVHPVVGMPQPVTHAADIGPGLARHELVCLVAKPDSGFAHALDTAFDGIPRPIVTSER